MKTETRRCPKCGAEYDLVAMYGGAEELRAVFMADSRESNPRPILAVLHVSRLFCPRRGCDGAKLIGTNDDTTGNAAASGQSGSALDFGA